MKILNYLVIIFICINTSVKADSKKTLIDELQKGGKLIFIRHAYAPGGGDPDNFDINDFDKFISTWDKEQNLVFVTHYVVISEILNYAPSSGEIIISDKSLKVIDTLEIEY